MTKGKIFAGLMLCLVTVTVRADITHIVLIWLPDSAPAATAHTIINEAAILSRIPGVLDLDVGTAVNSERDIVDDSFAVGISLRFTSKSALEAYLIHPLHLDYVARFIKPHSSKLQIYDIAH